MIKLLSLVVLAACAGSPQPLHQVAPARTVAPAPYELLVLDHTGATTRTVWIGQRSIEVGIAQRAKTDARVVIVTPEGHRTVFTPPLRIAGLPPDARGFDYWLGPAIEDEGGVIRFLATASSPTTIYTITWKLTWNAPRGTFDVAAPVIDSRPAGECLTCAS